MPGLARPTQRSLLSPAGWTFLEQLTLAAIDIGRLDVADVCSWVLAHSDAPQVNLADAAIVV